VQDFSALVTLVSPRMNREVRVVVQRGEQQLELAMTIAAVQDNGREVGRIGISPQATTVTIPDEMRALQKYGPLAALGQGFTQTWNTSALSLKIMWKMVIGEVSTKNLSGAISIVEFSGAAARQGGMAFLNWLALISISIGIFNLLPIPMLDGGQIVYQLVELLKGSPVSERVQQVSQQVGIAMLLMLLTLTLYNDIARHLS
jgi:regulator of sigma E protease